MPRQWFALADLERLPFIAIWAGTLSALSAAAGTIPGFGAGQNPSLAPLLREITPAVVNVSVRGLVREDNPLYQDPYFRQFFDLPQQLERRVEAAGSGVIVDAEHGYALTNNHVVEHAANIQVATKDGQTLSARIVGHDPATDIAVIQIRGGSNLKALPVGDSDKLEVGDFVVAIGNPLGLDKPSRRESSARSAAAAWASRDMRTSSRPTPRSILAIQAEHWQICGVS